MADLHICGTCKMQFNNIESFINHKKECVNNPVIAQSGEEKALSTAVSENQDPTVFETCESSIGPILEQNVEDKGPLPMETPEIVEVPNAFADGQHIDVPSHQSRPSGLHDQSLTLVNTNAQYVSAEEFLAQQNLSFSTTPQVAGQASAHQADAATYQTMEQSQALNTPAPVQQNITENASSQTAGQMTSAPIVTTTAPSAGVSKSKSEQKKKYSCTYNNCTYSTVHFKDLERHDLTHTGIKPHHCGDCGRCFSRLDKLKIHKRTHTGLKPYKCNQCSYATVDNSSLKAHQRVHNDERPYKCQICQYASRNSSQLTVHLRTHTGDSPFQCYICDAKFKVNSDLRRHIRRHTGEKPYQCPHCLYKCAIKGNLTKHIDINHSARNSMKCPECDFVTSSSRMFRDHKKKHITSATYMCIICNHVATSKTSLKVHLGIHTDEKPHKCSFCNFSTRQSGNIRLHIQRKHPDKWPVWCEKADGKVKGKKGKTKSMSSLSAASLLVAAAARAAATTSPKKSDRLKATCQKPFTCNICGESFVREDSLRCHTKHHQKIREAEIREGAALAVLQLKNPVTSTVGAIPTSSTVTGVCDANVITETTVVSSIPTAQTVEISQPAQVTFSESPAPATGVTTTSSAQRRGRARTRSGGHMTRATQSANMMAIMQNNENRAVEDNMQNMAISMRREQRQATDQSAPPVTQTHVSVIQTNPVPQPAQGNQLQPQTNQSYESQVISTSRMQPQSVVSAQVIAGPQGQHPQHVTVPQVGSRPAFMVSSSGLVRVVSDGTGHQQVQQTQQVLENQRNLQGVQVLIGENRTLQIIGQHNHVVQGQVQNASNVKPVLRQLLTSQAQTLPQMQTQQGAQNVVATLQGNQLVQEIPVQQGQVLNQQALTASQPKSALIVSQPSPGLIISNPQNQIISQNAAQDSQNHLVTAIINQHLHVVDQRQVVMQGQGQLQSSSDFVNQQGQVISQGQMFVPQGQTVMAVQNVGQGHSEGQSVQQGHIVQQVHNVQAPNQGNMVSTEGQQTAIQTNQSHVILQVVTGETNADGTPQMKTIQVPVSALQGLLANNRKEKDNVEKLCPSSSC